MTEVDYQLALLLEHKFEQERKDSEIAKTLHHNFQKEYDAKKKKTEDDLNDSLIAKSLQEQFQTEFELERPGQNLVYGGSSSSTNGTRNNAKCLTDPSWEVIDPTPDIHNLFIAFNERFFWNQLGSVCVSWSKRMTTCAGICSYQGRGGMCSIALSEPLLKLRPRKDLVETLLHEMIHAFLFVTNNNRDRDGHGPEFHRHMHRINNEAGTNITVYHDFHDEVRLYQQHWWKCTGPCQKWKPYFGMVRRAMNRAPGPTDRWWAEHSQKCGGQFIKVKEPEKSVKPQPGSTKNMPDIRKFLPPTKDSNGSSKNVKTISNNNSNSSVNKVISDSNNIFGFTNLSGNNNNNKNQKAGTLVKNSSSTIVVNKKPSTGTKDGANTTKSPLDKNRSLSVPGSILTSDNPLNSPDYSVVRNHWINKFSNNSATGNSLNIPSTSAEKNSDSKKYLDTNLKRPILHSTPNCSQKIPKLSDSFVDCPNCTKKIADSCINSHLDECLNSSESRKRCSNCKASISVTDFKEHFKNCTKESLDDDVFDIIDDNEKQCEVCNKLIPQDKYGEHVNLCLHNIFDKIEEDLKTSSNKDSPNESSIETKCLACNKNILKSDLDEHLEECMNLSHIFEDKNAPVEETKEVFVISEEVKKTDKLYNCPVCMKLIGESGMNDHIDVCLNNSDIGLDIRLGFS